jgi:hypothetical protein
MPASSRSRASKVCVLIVASTTLAGSARALADGADYRIAFRRAYQALADASQDTPLSCTRKHLDVSQSTPGHLVFSEQPAHYALQITDDEQYEGAFWILYSDRDSTHEFSTLVAYEGVNGQVLGRLSAISDAPDAEARTLLYSFDGFLTESTALDVVGTEARRLTYRSANPDSIPLLEIACTTGTTL